MQLIVIGVHRSGTSVVTRYLNMMGAYFGPEGVSTDLGIGDENPKGFWERRDVRRLNDLILEDGRSAWHDVVDFRPTELSPLAADAFQEKARLLILDLDAHRPWVLKDPRFCVTFPFWRPLLEMPIVVFVVRHPVEVAQSLARRNGFSVAFGLALWEAYSLHAIKAVKGLPRVLIDHGDMVADPVSSVQRLHCRLSDLGVAPLRQPGDREIASFFEEKLYRCRRTSADEPLMHATQVRLHESISNESAFSFDAIPELSPEAARLLRIHRQKCQDGETNPALTPRSSWSPILSPSIHLSKTSSRSELERLYLDTQDKLTRLEDAHFRLKHRYIALRQSYDEILGSRLWRFGAWVHRLRRLMKLDFLVSQDAAPGSAEEMPAWDPDGPATRSSRAGSSSRFFNPRETVIDVGVCVHDAPEAVHACLDSVLAHSPEMDHLFLVDDGCGRETADLIQAVAGRDDRCVVMRNPLAQGYTKAANLVFDQSRADILVLLNSDTIPPPGWLAKLAGALDANPDLGIVGPLSNAASWQSVPHRFAPDGTFCVNALPPDFTVTEMAKLVAAVSHRTVPRVPFVNGFCFAIKRAVIDRIGTFDAEAFPQGYGEENDYCVRAMQAGFSLGVVDDAYVTHAKSQSYSLGLRKKLTRAGSRTLRTKYGRKRVTELVDAMAHCPGLNAAIDRVRECLDRQRSHVVAVAAEPIDPPYPRILFLLPVRGGGGGAHSVIQEITGLRQLGADSRAAVRLTNKPDFEGNYAHLRNLDQMIAYFRSETELLDLAADVDVVVATVYHSVRLLKTITQRFEHILPAYYIQDDEPRFFTLGSPQWHEAFASYSAVDGMVRFAKTRWICDQVVRQHGVRMHKVAPSLNREIFYSDTPLRLDGTLLVAAMIRPATPRRSPGRTLRVLHRLKDAFGDQIEVHVFGCHPTDPALDELDTDFPFHHHGILTQTQVADLFRRAHLFLDLSEYQAFGRTGLEAMACSCATILPRKGGTHEFAVDLHNAILVEPYDEETCFLAAKGLLEDPILLARLIDEGKTTAESYSINRAAQTELSLLTRAFQTFTVTRRTRAAKRSVFVSRRPSETGRKPRILALMSLRGSAGFSGSAHIRLIRPFSHPEMAARFSLQPVTLDQVAKHQGDAIVVQRTAVSSPATAEKLVATCRKAGIPMVFEIDDAIWDLPSLHPEKRVYQEAISAVELLLEAADEVTVPTANLKERVSAQNPHVTVLPNALDGRLWHLSEHPRIESKPRDQSLNVLYMGTRTHARDLEIIAEGLARLERTHPGLFHLDLVGILDGPSPLPFAEVLSVPPHCLEYPAFVSWIRTQNRWHVGIAPLERNAFNVCKSAIKFFDYAALGLTTLASVTPQYAQVMQHGEHGLLISNDGDDWTEAILHLAHDERLLTRLRRNARRAVQQHHTLDTTWQCWEQVYSRVLGR